jgi:hypothetical protein
MTTIFKDHAQEPRDIEARLSTLEAASDAHAVKISDHGGLLISMDDELVPGSLDGSDHDLIVAVDRYEGGGVVIGSSASSMTIESDTRA